MINKLKKICITILLSFVVTMSPANAIQKLDGTDPGLTIPQKIQKKMEEMEQKYNEAMDKLNGKLRKAFGAEGAALIKSYVKKHGANIVKNAAKGQFNVGDLGFQGISDAVTTQIGEFKLDMANISALAQDYTQAVEKAKVARTEAMNAQMAKYEAERAVVNEALLKDPTNEDLRKKLDDLNVNITNLKGQIDQVMAENKLADEKIEKYKKEMDSLMKKVNNINAQKVSEDMLKTLNSKVASLFPNQDNEDVQEAYATSIYKLFLGEYDFSGGEALARVNKARQKEYYDSLRNMAIEYLNTFNDMEKTAERSKSCTEGMVVADGINGQQTMQICTDLQNARAAAGQVSLMLARMRFRAMQDIQRWNDKYKLREYSGDPTVFNLDNYIFTKKDLKFNVRDKIKQAISNFKGF